MLLDWIFLMGGRGNGAHYCWVHEGRRASLTIANNRCPGGRWLQVCCWVHEELCLVANVGDAKAVLARRPPVEQVKTGSVIPL